MSLEIADDLGIEAHSSRSDSDSKYDIRARPDPNAGFDERWYAHLDMGKMEKRGRAQNFVHPKTRVGDQLVSHKAVYKITNVANGRAYLGVTRNLDHRLFLHGSNARNFRGEALHEDMRAFGCAKFFLEIIYVAPDPVQGSAQETLLMKEHGTYVPYGYNRSNGYRFATSLTNNELEHTDDPARGKQIMSQLRAVPSGVRPSTAVEKALDLQRQAERAANAIINEILDDLEILSVRCAATSELPGVGAGVRDLLRRQGEALQVSLSTVAAIRGRE